ncbi:MFS transporter [Actinomadura sp. DC4]|uniref:MFS transporter n=1 Tax=Actinomadura sp. DC4 TaxID=3055069 RepID=UPI0025B0620C|nr:MFS transporter [Actinomadura sp. DC4]MDN3353822.1 MFS transporter [Actinomadura sp. DC4]
MRLSGLAFYRPYAAMFAGIFFCLLGVGASLATLPFYVLQELDGNKVEVGVVTAAIAVAAVVSRPIAGRIADRHGYKPIMLCGAGICVLAGAAYYAAFDVPLLVAVRILHGVGEGTVYTSGAAWLVRLCPVERRGRVVGLYGTSMWLGITLGAFFGTVAMRVSGFGAVWGLCVVVGALGLLVVSVRRPPPRTEVTPTTRAAILPVSTVLPGIALSLAALGYAALAAFVALHMEARGVDDGIAALNAFGVTYVGVRLFIGGLPDRLGARQVAFWSALIEAVGLLIVAVAHDLVTVIAGGLIMGAGLSLLFPALALLVMNRTDPSQQGAALGGFTSFWDVGLAVGGPFSGVVANLAGYPSVYWVMLACAVASALLSWATNPARRPAAVSP